jgi:hypothetical protein
LSACQTLRVPASDYNIVDTSRLILRLKSLLKIGKGMTRQVLIQVRQILSKQEVKGKGKVVPVRFLTQHPMKAYWRSGGIALRIL